MTLIDPLHPLQSTILSVLSEHKALTMPQLWQKMQEQHGVDVSKPNLYRTVAQMIEVQILVRTGGRISLNLVWIPHLMSFADKVKQTYVDQSHNVLDLQLAENERREFYADSLLGLDPIWFHVLLAFTELPQTHDWYIYNAHPWYSLGMRQTEMRGYQSLTAKGVTCHLLYGNDTFLDRYGDKLIRVKNFHTYIAETDTPFPKEGFVLWVINDYLLECIFPDAISRHFAFFFQTVQSVSQFDPQLFADVFQMKARCKITVRRNKKEAEKLRGVMKELCEKSGQAERKAR